MKTPLSLLLISLSLAGFTAGCRDSRAQAQANAPGAAPGHRHTEACTYKEGAGLSLSEEAAAFVALETAPAQLGSEGAVRAPDSAVLQTAKGRFVYVQNGDRYLRTPAADLYEGDVIVTRGAQSLWLAELQAINGGVGCADGH